MDTLKHKNVIKYIEYGTGDIVRTEDNVVKSEKRVNYIVLELAQQGDLFDVIARLGSFDESVAKYFFIQLMKGLEFCHDQGVIHRDLTLSNLVLDQFYNIKIADFGLNGPFYLLVNKGNLDTKLGTPSYMAPEVLLDQPYEGQKIDVFAAGVILFCMVNKHPPFIIAQPTDRVYRCIAAGRFDLFWKIHC